MVDARATALRQSREDIVDAVVARAVLSNMRILGSLLLGITLAASAAAQTPIPTILLGERAIGAPTTSDDPFPGVSAVASNGKDFLVATSKDNLFMGRSHALMLVDSAGHPTLATSDAFPFGAGDIDGVASNGRDFLVV